MSVSGSAKRRATPAWKAKWSGTSRSLSLRRPGIGIAGYDAVEPANFGREAFPCDGVRLRLLADVRDFCVPSDASGRSRLAGEFGSVTVPIPVIARVRLRYIARSIRAVHALRTRFSTMIIRGLCCCETVGLFAPCSVKIEQNHGRFLVASLLRAPLDCSGKQVRRRSFLIACAA